jgi:eukaryotic-like serine/threonine-protein kinase
MFTEPVTVPASLSSKYRIEECLGEGGMGVVHAAYHLELKSRVAIKVLQPKLAADENARARFLREARLAASIEGDHSTKIYDVGAGSDGTPYMVMEYLAGESVDTRLARDGALSLSDTATIMMQLLSVLAEAHARGLVHRDLKPGNLFLAERRGEPIWVKVMDFGISKMGGASGEASAPENVALTEPRTLLGSPEYMSPEQLRDSATVDARADIWACGVVMFELLSGTMPFEGQSLADLYAQIISMTPKPIIQVSKVAVPAALADLITRCLDKDRAKRPASAAELAEVLSPLASESARALLPRVRAWSESRDGGVASPRGSLAPASVAPALEGPSQDEAKGPSPSGAGVVAGASKVRARRGALVGLALVLGAGVMAYSVASRSPAPRETQVRASTLLSGSVPQLEPFQVPVSQKSAAPDGPSATPSAVVTAPPVPGPGKKPAVEKRSPKATPERIQGIDGIEIIP